MDLGDTSQINLEISTMQDAKLADISGRKSAGLLFGLPFDSEHGHIIPFLRNVGGL
jgi:hypothetical protein